MNTPMELTHDYIATHDLRDASATIYFGSTRALLRHFGQTVSVEAITHRAVLAWRKKVLANGLSKQSWNTYSNHMRTVWGYAIEQGTLTCTTINPFKKTAVIPPRRSSKTIDREAIRTGREWLKSLVIEEESTHQRSQITPAWFWLAVYEMFYYSGIRLNGLLSLRYRDINWENGRIYVRAETEKTHREYAIPIAPGLEAHLQRLKDAADSIGFLPDDQLFNVNRFSSHYRSKTMNTDQVEGMYRKLMEKFKTRMTPHRFRYTLATDLMRQPERSIHLTKSLLNHSNIATTMGYIEADFDVIRAALHQRSLAQGAITFERYVDEQMPPPVCPEPPEQPSTPVLIEFTPAPASLAPIEGISIETPPPPPKPVSSPHSKLLTQVASLPSERYSLDQAILPVGTGLIHELAWDGPGTWWKDLSLPPPPPADEQSDASTLFALMSIREGMKCYDWG